MIVRLRLMLIPALMLASGGLSAQEPEVSGFESSSFDQELATELGADDYGMRRYVMVMLEAGDSAEQDPEVLAELQRGHMANMQRLAEEGLLVMAGPFIDGGERRGIFVFAVESVEQAKELTASDPAIQAGRLKADYWPWYGSAALMKLGEIHERIARQNP
jgi:uncharacterized protein YciI